MVISARWSPTVVWSASNKAQSCITHQFNWSYVLPDYCETIFLHIFLRIMAESFSSLDGRLASPGQNAFANHLSELPYCEKLQLLRRIHSRAVFQGLSDVK